MEELCTINGKKKEISFYLDIMCDDYMKIAEAIGGMITVIR